MAASDQNPRREAPSSRGAGSLSGPELTDRLDEEIARAERHSTGLSCLLVVVEHLDAMAREHGVELREQMLTYMTSALSPALRRFDRIGRPGEGELLILLPGAGAQQAEVVARRVLERLRAVKLESGGERRPLSVSVGLAAWDEPTSAEDLFLRARKAVVRGSGNGGSGDLPDREYLPRLQARS
jgi:two-component system cell cycle response regulator